MTRILAALGAALLACAPAAAQLDTRTMPLASTLTGTERSPAVQGSGCPSKTTPCANVAVTPDLIRAYAALTLQTKDADLDAIAALTTTSFGRSLLTQADAAAVRSAIGAVATGGDISAAGALATTGVTAGSCTACNLTIDAKGRVTAQASGSVGSADTSAWTAYTPTVTANSGTLGSVTAVGRYKTIGKSILINIVLTITNNGSGASYIIASLPAASLSRAALSGLEAAQTGAMIGGNIRAGESIVNITRFDAGYPAASGYVLVLSGVYETN